MNKPLIIKKSTFPKRNYQTKDNFVCGIGYNEQGKILIEVRRKGKNFTRILEVPKPYIQNITATSLESAISQAKKIARKRHNSLNSIWNNQNIPIIIKGIELKRTSEI